MPGFEFSREVEQLQPVQPAQIPSTHTPVVSPPTSPVNGDAPRDTYYNARLDPKNFLEGPLSHNPATRLRQLLARPGIVVSAQQLHQLLRLTIPIIGCARNLRRYQRSLRYRGRLPVPVPEVGSNRDASSPIMPLTKHL